MAKKNEKKKLFLSVPERRRFTDLAGNQWIRIGHIDADNLLYFLHQIYPEHNNRQISLLLGMSETTLAQIKRGYRYSPLPNHALEKIIKGAEASRRKYLIEQILKANGMIRFTGKRNRKELASVLNEARKLLHETEEEFVTECGLPERFFDDIDAPSGKCGESENLEGVFRHLKSRTFITFVPNILKAGLCAKSGMTADDVISDLMNAADNAFYTKPESTPRPRIAKLPRKAVAKTPIEKTAKKVSTDMLTLAARCAFLWGRNEKLTDAAIDGLLAKLPEIATDTSAMKFLKGIRDMSIAGKEKTEIVITKDEAHSILKAMLG